MSDYAKCKNCREWGWMREHRCQPVWNVWQEDEADEHSTEEFRLVHARTAQEAAEKCAQEMNDDGPQERDLYVREWGEPASGVAQLFEVGYEVQIEYTARTR